IDDQPAADARPDRDAHDVAAAARRAEPPLAHGGAVGVVVQRRWKLESRRDSLAQRKVTPSQVRCDDDNALFAIEWTGRADADAEKILSRRAGLVDRVE